MACYIDTVSQSSSINQVLPAEIKIPVEEESEFVYSAPPPFQESEQQSSGAPEIKHSRSESSDGKFNRLWRDLSKLHGDQGSQKLFWRTESKEPHGSPHPSSSSLKRTSSYNGIAARNTFSRESSPKQPQGLSQRDRGPLAVRTYRARQDGSVIGLLEDGGVVLRSGTLNSLKGSSNNDIHSLEEMEAEDDDESWKLERQKSEIVHVVPQVKPDGSHVEELTSLFDLKEDGLVTRQELTKALSKSASVNKVKLKDSIVSDLVELIMDEIDIEGQGVIHVDDLAQLMYGDEIEDRLLKIPSYNHKAFSGTSKSMFTKVDTLAMNRKPSSWDWVRGIVFSKTFREEAAFFLSNNYKTLFAFVLFFTANAVLAVERYIYFRTVPEYTVVGEYLCIAKMGAEMVKFNAAVLLFCVCRWTIAFLRGSLLNYIVPFDENLLFHKSAVFMVLVGSLVHTVAIMAGVYVKTANAPFNLFDLVLGPAFGHVQPSYASFYYTFNAVSGFILWGALLGIGAVSPTRLRSLYSQNKATAALASFSVFWWMHYSMAPVFLFFLFYHGTHNMFPMFPDHDTWKYIAGPLFLYLLEKINKFLFTRIGQKSLNVIQVEILPNKVLCLHLSNPPFKFQSGMYVFLQCPGVSSFEWHPFSITSAPSDFELTVHIRAVGDWTNAMFEFWKNEVEAAQKYGKVTSDGKIMVSIGPAAFLTRFRYPRVNVDGPHGSPTQEYDGYRVIMLVGAGIGVTPIASVVRDVLHKTENRQKYPEFRVEKVHFFWTTREQESFEWFSNIMTQAAEEDTEGIVDMHNYLTSAYGDDDPRSFLLKAAKDRFHARTGHDIITNTKTKVATHFARPDWNEIFKAIAKRSPDTVVGVFFCGPRALQVELQANCKKHSMRADNGATFAFHTENF